MSATGGLLFEGSGPELALLPTHGASDDSLITKTRTDPDAENEPSSSVSVAMTSSLARNPSVPMAQTVPDPISTWLCESLSPPIPPEPVRGQICQGRREGHRPEHPCHRDDGDERGDPRSPPPALPAPRGSLVGASFRARRSWSLRTFREQVRPFSADLVGDGGIFRRRLELAFAQPAASRARDAGALS